MDILTHQAELAIAKIENSQLLTGELLRLGIAIGQGKRIRALEQLLKPRIEYAKSKS